MVWLKPKFDFKTVTEKYGYPIISKEQAQFIDQYRTAKSEKTKNTRLNGDSKGRFKISEKWKPFLDTEFKVSDRCCNIMKKNPIKIYEKANIFKEYLYFFKLLVEGNGNVKKTAAITKLPIINVAFTNRFRLFSMNYIFFNHDKILLINLI